MDENNKEQTVHEHRDVADQLNDRGNHLDNKEFDQFTQLIEGVLKETQERFKAMSDQIIHRIDDMAKRVDDLERNITDLMEDAGININTNREIGNNDDNQA